MSFGMVCTVVRRMSQTACRLASVCTVVRACNRTMRRSYGSDDLSFGSEGNDVSFDPFEAVVHA